MLNARGGDHGARLDWLAAGAVWSCLLLLPVGRSVEVPVLALALGGLWLVVRKPRELFSLQPQRLFAGLFLCVWLPVIFSLPDAVNFTKTASVAVTFPRLYLSGVLIIALLGAERRQRYFFTLCAVTLAFWVADGLYEIIFGQDLFGFEPLGVRINALFGQHTPKYSMILAVLSPLLFEYARRNWRWPLVALIAATTIAVVLISGTRSAWISTAVILAAYAVVYARPTTGARWRQLALSAALLGAFAGALYLASPRFKVRVDQTLTSLSGRAGQINAIDHRFWIWRGALRMYRANPINGVGARDFRYAYAQYAAPGDPFVRMDPPLIPTNSHQMLLEVASETGTLGLVGLIAMCGLLLVAFRAGGSGYLLGPGLCLLVALFPLNTHLAFFSSFWSQLLWWLIALFCAASREAPAIDRR